MNNTAPTQNSTLTSNADGHLDVGGDKITNVADGEVSSTSTDTVNGSQLHDVKEITGKGFNIDADNKAAGVTDADNIAPGEPVKFTSTERPLMVTIMLILV